MQGNERESKSIFTFKPNRNLDEINVRYDIKVHIYIYIFSAVFAQNQYY